MKKKFSIALLLVLTVNFSFGQKFQKGSISFLDGKVKNGFIIVPKTAAKKTLLFKTTLNSGKEKIKRELVSSVTVYSETGKSYVFENRYISLRKGKLTKKKALLFKISDGYAKVYFAGNEYKTDKQGNVIISYSFYVTKDLPTFNYYIRKKGEDYVSYLAMTSTSPTMFGLNKVLKKNASILLSEDKELVERINNDEFKHEDIIEIMKIYNKFMKNK